ncbi:MAG TPA: preprotein translocase subunit SecG [Leucothrix mucor]|nr:preprotein translocase subunit SecG [Leucothrix mucor]
MLYNVLLIVQILVALSIIGLVLIQHGKGADAGAAFGGGAAGTVFGSKGSGNFLSRATAILAAIFFANSLFLAWLTAHPDTGGNTSVVPETISDSVMDAPATSAVAVPSPSDVPATVTDKAIETAPAKPADVPE